MPIPVRTEHVVVHPFARIYAISDTHACLDVLHQSFDIIQTHRRHNPPRRGQQVHIFTLGDMIDKGEDAKAVIDALHKKNGSNITNLMGNHERDLVDFINGPKQKNVAEWIDNSLFWLTKKRGDHFRQLWDQDTFRPHRPSATRRPRNLRPFTASPP